MTRKKKVELTGVVNTKHGLNVRTAAGKDNDIVRVLAFGDTVAIAAQKDGWYEIAPGEWVDGSFIQLKDA